MARILQFRLEANFAVNEADCFVQQVADLSIIRTSIHSKRLNMSNRIGTLTQSPLAQLPLAGHLLVATNRNAGTGFTESVCLVLHHGSEGSMGLMLNRALDFDIENLWKVLNASKSQASQTVRFGGPMSGPILALHNQEQLAEVSPATGVYIAAHLDKLQKLIASQQGEVRLVIGQVIWKGGQLEHELAEGMWLPVPATPALVFAPEEDMWRQGMIQAGNCFIAGMTDAVVPPALEAN